MTEYEDYIKMLRGEISSLEKFHEEGLESEWAYLHKLVNEKTVSAKNISNSAQGIDSSIDEFQRDTRRLYLQMANMKKGYDMAKAETKQGDF